MPEYIEREAFIKRLKNEADKMRDENIAPIADLEQVMWERDMALETLKEHGIGFCEKSDMVEVVRDRWIKRQFADEPTAFGYRCSECHLTYEVDTNYCPNCGAKMDGGNKNA